MPGGERSEMSANSAFPASGHFRPWWLRQWGRQRPAVTGLMPPNCKRTRAALLWIGLSNLLSVQRILFNGSCSMITDP
jgi:hypothetical protein